jgi:hypothetical protein
MSGAECQKYAKSSTLGNLSQVKPFALHQPAPGCCVRGAIITHLSINLPHACYTVILNYLFGADVLVYACIFFFLVLDLVRNVLLLYTRFLVMEGPFFFSLSFAPVRLPVR